MQFYEIDSFFVMASQGDQKAYEELMNFYVDSATKIVQNEIRGHQVKVKAEEFQDLIYETFIEMMTNYSSERSKFSYFLRYTLNSLLPERITSAINRLFIADKSLDDVGDDGTIFIEAIEQPNSLSIEDQIRMNNFKYEIASPSKEKTRKNSLTVKVLKMQAIGMSIVEISETLNLTTGKVRYVLKKAEKEIDNLNFKIDIK